MNSCFLRQLVLTCCLFSGVSTCGQVTVAPGDALKHVGSQVRIRFLVMGIGRAGKDGVDVTLASLDSYKEEGCLIIRVPPAVREAFEKSGEDFQKQFRNREVEVTGTVQMLKPGGLTRAAIFVTSASDLRLVESPGTGKTDPPASMKAKSDSSTPGTTVREISPAEARQLIGAKVRMKFTVKSVGRNGELHVLNSEDSYKTADNVQILISADVAAQYLQEGIERPGPHFLNKQIEVVGSLEERSPGGVVVPAIMLKSTNDLQYVLQSTRASIGVAQLVDQRVDLYLQNGDRFADVLITELEAGEQAESFSSVKVLIGKTRRLKYKAADIEDIVFEGIPLDLSYDKASKVAFVDSDKRNARLLQAAETERRVLAKGRRLWPRITADEREEWLLKNRDFAKTVQQHFSELPIQIHETEYFVVVTDIPLTEGKKYFPYLDQLYDEMCRAFGIPLGRNIWHGKCIVCAFQERRDFIRFESEVLKKTGGNVANSGGLCHPNIDGQVVISLFKKEFAARFAYVLVHETSHGIVSRFVSDVGVPSWINEGMAVWIGDLIVKADETLEKSQRESIVALRQQQTLAGFFDAQQTEGNLYGAASAMVDILIRSNKGSFRKFFIDMKEGYSQEEALQRTFNLSLHDLASKYGRQIGLPNLRP